MHLLFLFSISILSFYSNICCANPYFFSKLGAIPQVDAAFNAASKGGTVVAYKSSESIIILTYSDYKKDSLINKIRVLSPTLSICYSGITSDGEYLFDKLFQEVCNNLYAYGTEININRISKLAGEILHQRTISAFRPLGIKTIIFGIDKNNNLFLNELDPVGNIYNCKVSCLG